MSNTRTFEFQTLLADSRAVVDVQCQIDSDGDCVSFDHVKYEGFDVSEVLAESQWIDLEWQASEAYKAEQDTQAGIDYDSNHSLEALYGLSKPSFNIR